MTRRGVRLLLVLLLFAGVGVAAWQYYQLELDALESRGEVEQLEEFRNEVARSVAAARAAQQAYLAPGQGIDFWRTQFAEAVADMTRALENLRATAGLSPEPVAGLDAADRALKVYDGLDRKVRSFIDADNRLMAADVIYEDALKTSRLIVAGVDDAYGVLASPHAAAVIENRRRQWGLAGGTAVGALLVALMLLPVGRAAHVPIRSDAAAGEDSDDLHLGHGGGSRPRADPSHLDVDVMRAGAVEMPVITRPPMVAAAAAPAAAVRSLAAEESLDAAARVCTDLARVKDGEQLRDALGRAARVLDASGVIVWIADGTGRSLKPLLTYGYPEEALRRIPTLPRDADNATAAAYRESTLKVVEATDAAPGAIAVPIPGPQGSMGVLAAEIGHHLEASAYTRAVAQIVAAQLAVLIPPETPADDTPR